MRAEIVGLKGGKKQFWLRTHRKEVENYYFEHGPEATMREYHMGPDTLRRFFERSRKETAINKLSQADKLVMEYARAGIAEVRQRVRDLEDWRDEAQPVIDFGRALINATYNNIQGSVQTWLFERVPKKRTPSPLRENISRILSCRECLIGIYCQISNILAGVNKWVGYYCGSLILLQTYQGKWLLLWWWLGC
ncbi:MAG: hypothetical protein PHG35_01935 [Dehalococcoidales bacterium]|nr:hypothetical protein [Dehalococcoidales bacterium]